MRPLPYTNGAASITLGIALALMLGVQLRTAITSNLAVFRSRGRTQRMDRWSLPLIAVTTGAGIVAAAQAASHATGAAIAPAVPAVRWLVFVLGIVAIVAGSGLRQWAISALGRFFTFDVRITDEQRVVDSGPYRWVRHPSYTGLLLSLVGIGLTLGNWLSVLALAVLPTVGLVQRVRVEEAALVAGLGEPYERFAATRSRLVPGLW
jgi:protein-S-isoprenylcysteine O-methyltransferase Ste14